MSSTSPLVTVLTPVYNGEKYLKDCIESILSQSYLNWEYIIVNNCSTDNTLAIAKQYAAKDSRIRIHNNKEFVDVIQNHNIAFQLIGPGSKYCKLVQADDWLFPECIEQMVNTAEATPSIGVVGSYCLAGRRIRCDGLPYSTTVISGVELCKLTLLDKLYLFWSPSCLLIKSDLIFNRRPFYASAYLNADVDALYEILQHSDFGFVHQVLSYIRTHDESMTAKDANKLNVQRLSHIHLLSKHGSKYLDKEERKRQSKLLFDKYYRSLAQAIFDLKKKEFWVYHSAELVSLGHPLNKLRLMSATIYEIINNPRRSFRKLKIAFQNKR